METDENELGPVSGRSPHCKTPRQDRVPKATLKENLFPVQRVAAIYIVTSQAAAKSFYLPVIFFW